MSRLRALSAGSCLLVAIAFLPSPVMAQGWSEDFNGTALDSARWTYDVGGNGNGNAELQFYSARPDNVKVTGGDLVITALRETYIGNSNAFTSGRIKSNGRTSILYGTIEGRIKMPDLREGLWPAFWLLGENIGQVGWPACGEIDIVEMGHVDARTAGKTNQRVGATTHWNAPPYTWFSQSIDAASPLNGAYHLFRLDWAANAMSASLDGTTFWNYDDSNSVLPFHAPAFLIFNLAVGGNFTGLTAPASITATMPAEMHVDYVHVTGAGAQVTLGRPAKTGNFGIFTDSTSMASKLNIGTDSVMNLWNNMTATTTTPQEGANAWSWNMAAANWWGAGVLSNADLNMKNYSDGKMHVWVKTTTTETIGFGVASSGAGEGWFDIVNGGTSYGLVRDGAWHEVVIPANQFANVDWPTVKQPFMIRGGAPAAAIAVSVDNVWWEPSGAAPTPQNGDFVVYSDNAARVMTMNSPADGQFFVWSNTLTPTTVTPFEGAQALSYTSAAGQTWFGAAFSAAKKYNLTAYSYANSRLHVALKTSSQTVFYIGMKSGTVNDVGQRWIKFAPGADPYGFSRNGAWHAMDIPMSDFIGYVDLSEVSQLFEILGVNGAISDIAIDDVRFTGGGAANGGGPTPTATPRVTATSTATATATARATATATTGATATFTPTPSGTNVAQGRPCTASSALAPCANAFDGNAGTRWESTHAVDPQWIFVDLGATYNVNKVILTWETAAGKSYQIQTSADAAAWTNIYTTTTGAGGTETLNITGTGRYVRMYGTVRTTAYGYSLWEFAVFGTSGATPTATTRPTATSTPRPTSTATATARATATPTSRARATATNTARPTATATSTSTPTPSGAVLLSQGHTATASSVENAGVTANLAVDGNTTGTRWASLASDPQWIYVDLGAAHNVTKVVLTWEAAYGKSYQLQTSNDAVAWSAFYTTTTGPGGTETLNVTGNGRYVRMYGTVRGTQWGYSLWEFQVYGN